MTHASPYESVAARLRERGYSAIPIGPGTKFPGQERGGHWLPLSAWQQYCTTLPPDFLHQRWSSMPEAGIGIAHGRVVGLDIDTDEAEIAAAIYGVLPKSPAIRRGAKGELGYYRPAADMPALGARVRWYRTGEDRPCLELLMEGSQSVLPPTIHPDTQEPYRWITGEALDEFEPDELPELPADVADRLDAALAPFGITRQAPRRVKDREYDRPAANGHDLEKPFFRSINDRALEPTALAQWFPALNLPKTRNRGGSRWEAIAVWRPSGSGRPNSERNPNLKVINHGIVDFGADRSYTAVDVVMCARDCSALAAAEWLQQYIRPEDGAQPIALDPPKRKDPPADDPAPAPVDLGSWTAAPVFHGPRPAREIKPAILPSDAEFQALVLDDPGPFPVAPSAVPGLLGEAASWIDAASVVASEAGGLAVALPLLGAIMGRGYATPSNLRTNVYTVALAGSGMGKTTLVAPAKEILFQAGCADLLGQDRIASGPGLLSMLTSNPCRVCFLDEFGHMLEKLGRPGAAAHASQILDEFTKLYSDAGTLFRGTAYASREPEPIDCPHLCVFGMATPDQFWRAFGSGNLEDGSIARYLVMPLGASEFKDPDRSLEQELVDGLRGVREAMSGRVTGNLGQPEVCVAQLSDVADAGRQELRRTMIACAEYAEQHGVRGAAPILRRVVENALKIALISAVGRDPKAPVIESCDWDLGHAIARWSARLMIMNIRSHIADNQIERDTNTVERKIEQAGAGGILKSVLKDRCRDIRKRDFQEIVEALEEAGVIHAWLRERKTRKALMLVHSRFVADAEEGDDGAD